MSALPKIDMTEVTRLTREGRLGEAMAVLQGRTTDAHPVEAPSPRTGVPMAGVLDLLPPASPGGAWRAPPTPIAGATWPGRSPGLGATMGAKASSAPPIAPGARFDEAAFTSPAGARAYKLYVPSGYRGQAVPLVVMLHGCTQSPDDFAAGTNMNAVAEEQTFLVAYPAQPPSANVSRCWNWFNPGDQQRGRGEPSLIAGITRQIMAEFRVDAARVYIAGLSAGGAAAAIMGSAYPDLYAAIGVHSGLACGAARDMPSALCAMSQGGPAPAPRARQLMTPTIVFHGDADHTVNPVNADRIVAQSKGADTLRTTETRGRSKGGVGYLAKIHADAAGLPMLEQWTLHGAGHAWSGGSAAGSYTDPNGPDASREMVRFFLKHRLAPVA